MKAFIYLFIFIITTFLGYAQQYSKGTLTIDSEIEGDLYLVNNNNDELVIIIPGSGPTNRNGNQPPNMITNAYKMLAEELASQSVNVFTYDKRFLGQLKQQKKIDESKHVFQDNIHDLNLIINTLKDRFKKITLIGHSEGSLIGNLAAIDNPSVNRFVSIAGQGETIDKVMEKQIAQNSPFLQKSTQEILAKLKNDETVDVVIPMLQSLFRPTVQPYLISWIKINPTDEIQKLSIPILIISGDKDIQIDTMQGEKLHLASPTSELVVLHQMNHILKEIDQDDENLKSYNDRTKPLHPQLTATIATFIKNK